MAKVAFEFFQLRCFLAVAEELNFRRAAARLNMTQPPLSRQIKLLEDRIGITLLDRDNRSVRLTPAGSAFRTAASELLERAQYAVLIARQAERGQAGTVTMGFVPSAGLDFVPRIVSSLKRDMPSVRFNPVEMMSYEITEALMSGRIDLGLTRTTGSHSEIVSTRVVREPFVLACPLGHRLCVEGTADISDIDGEDYIGYSTDRGGYLRDIHSALFATTGIFPRIVQEVSQTQTILSLVNVGLGIALVPRSAMVMQMANLHYRAISIPDQFISTLYLNAAKSRAGLLQKNVRDVILTAMHETIESRKADEGIAAA